MSLKLSEDLVGFKRHSYPPSAEMNVTPFVDVMLVLLIIFMVAAPLATVTVPVDLPQNSAAPTPPPAEPVTVTIQTDGTIYIDQTRTDLSHFVPAILTATKQSRATPILLRGDKHLEYGRLMDVMNQLSDNGYVKVGLVADPTDQR